MKNPLVMKTVGVVGMSALDAVFYTPTPESSSFPDLKVKFCLELNKQKYLL